MLEVSLEGQIWILVNLRPWLFLEAIEVSWQILQVQFCPILALRRVSAMPPMPPSI